MARYKMVFLPCPATDKSYWGSVLGESDTILGLWDLVGWRGNWTNYDQEIAVIDSKKNVQMTADEYAAIINQLKGWA